MKLGLNALNECAEANELFPYGVWGKPLESFANLNLLNACILPFWCLKKSNFKGCDSEN